jgi:hypothetical protein
LTGFSGLDQTTSKTQKPITFFNEWASTGAVAVDSGSP